MVLHAVAGAEADADRAFFGTKPREVFVTFLLGLAGDVVTGAEIPLCNRNPPPHFAGTGTGTGTGTLPRTLPGAPRALALVLVRAWA